MNIAQKIIEAHKLKFGSLPPLQQCSVSCWACRYCDKESVLKGDKWVLTRTGYCLAEKSAVNGENDFYKKVYVNTIYSKCSQFEPCS